jgi:hypothetical protein
MPNNSESKKRWACVKDNKVEQVIIWDGLQEWPQANTYTMLELPDNSPVGPDWDYDNGKFIDNRPVTTWVD